MTCETDAILAVTDGTTRIDLLRGPVRLDSWRPAVPQYKAGGVYQDNPMADGRALLFARFDNVYETMSIKAHAENPDAVILFIENLQALLQKAANYGKTNWQNEPVWLEARARNESNTRYALIISGSIPELENPYTQPFRQHDGRAVMDKLTLSIEHELWQSHRPGEAGCAELYVRPDLDRQTYADRILDTEPFACWPLTETSGTVAYNISRGGSGMNGTHDTVTLNNLPFTNGDPTPFYDLGAGNTRIQSTPLSATGNWRSTGTIMAWIRTDSGIIWTDGDPHYIVNIGLTGTDAIYIYKSANDYEIAATIKGNGTTNTLTYTLPSTDDLTAWIPITITWRLLDQDPYTLFFRLFVMGQQRDAMANYGVFLNGIMDASETVIGAADNTGTDSFSADICYVTMWDRALTQAEIVALHLAPETLDDETSCEDIVFVANKHYDAPLTHIYHYDASATNWSSNLLEGDPPYNLLPATPAAGDIAYFGITTGTSTTIAGTFNNLVFDLDYNGGSGFVGTWEYYNGSTWATIDTTANDYLMDHTLSLWSNGVTSVHWDTLGGWVTHNLQTTHGVGAPNISAFWVRFRVTSVSSPDTPTQQNRHVYTCTWGCIDINPDSLTGTLPALIKLELANKKQSSDSSYDEIARMFVGGRSVSRGERFSAYLNLIETSHNVSGIRVAYGTDTAATNSLPESPSWRGSVYSGGAGATYEDIITLSLTGLLAAEYYGRYRLFLRLQPSSMTDAATDMRIKITSAGVAYTPSYRLDNDLPSNTYTVLDFGSISLGPADLLQSDERMTEMSLAIQVKESGTSAHSIYFYDFVVLPIDEWAGEFRASDRADSVIAFEPAEQFPRRAKLVIDSASNPKRAVRAYNEEEDNSGGIVSFWQCINKSKAFVNTGRQRLWVLALSLAPGGGSLHVARRAKSSIVMRVKLEVVNRYIGMRGDR